MKAPFELDGFAGPSLGGPWGGPLFGDPSVAVGVGYADCGTRLVDSAPRNATPLTGSKPEADMADTPKASNYLNRFTH